jgi:sulfur relay protein TusB/DsrH
MSDTTWHEPGRATIDACLHLLMNPDQLTVDECLDCCVEGDSVVLMNSAVLLLAQGSTGRLVNPLFPVYCLEPDLLAHGLAGQSVPMSIRQIHECGLVDLVRQHRHCLSWK